MLKVKLFSLLCLVALFAGTGINDGYKPGDTVEDFKLKNIDGKPVSLSDYSDTKGVILIFDCNTCPVSKAYLERIKALHAKYASKGFPVVAINPNDPNRSPGDSYDEMVKYAADKGIKYNYLQDADQSVTREFGATNTPHVYILKKEGKSHKVAYVGAIDNNTRDANAADKKYVEDAVDALLKGKTPEVNKTKAIGCTIKWKAA